MGEYNITIMDEALHLETNDDIFSPSAADKGTLAMLSRTEFNGKTLDLGCGCGIVGILAAKKLGSDNVVMSDFSANAVEQARKNAALNGVPDVRIVKSDGFAEITDDDFMLILSNPPYHTDFSVAKGFIEGGFKHLNVGGKLLMVTKRREWYENKLRSVFGGVRVAEVDGYFVFEAEKRSETVKKPVKPKKQMSAKLMRKQARGKRNG